MSKFLPLPITPAPIPEDRYAQNGDYSTVGFRRAAHALNYASAAQTRVLYQYAGTRDAAAPGSASENAHYFAFRTSENLSKVKMLVSTSFNAAATTSTGEANLVLYDGSTTYTSDSIYRAKGQNSPLLQWASTSLSTDDGLQANTNYRGRLTLINYIQIDSIIVYEEGGPVLDSSVTGVCDPSYWETYKPIYDAGAQDIITTASKIHSHNGKMLISFGGPEGGGTVPSVSGTTEVNILDTSITGGTFSATDPGFTLNTQYLDTLNDNVKVQTGVYADRTSGTGTLSVYVKNSSGTVIAINTIGDGTNPFESDVNNFDAAATDFVNVTMAASSAGAAWDLYAFGMWLYET